MCVKVLEKEPGNIIAWIYGGPLRLENMDTITCHMRYYGSRLTGIAAINAAIDLHEALVEWAEAQRCYSHVVSLGSPFDERFVLARALKSVGWQQRGYAAVLKLGDN